MRAPYAAPVVNVEEARTGRDQASSSTVSSTSRRTTANDERRTQYLATHGVRAIRFSDRDVLTEVASVLKAVVVALT